jgi:ATP-binding cassette subfamily G (WHITE) protein 2 (SNQ2)
MYRLSPYTYLIEAALGQGSYTSLLWNFQALADIPQTAIGKQNINCTPVELVTLTPPSGQTCGSYMQQYISSAGGYLTNPDASSDCKFCSVRTTDQFFGSSFNIEYSKHWRDLGFMMAFVAFNVSILHFLYS